MRRIALILVGVVVCTVGAAPVPKTPGRAFGPEWVKEKDQFGQDEHVRKIELIQLAQANSNYLHTRLPLEDYNRDLYVTEGLDWKGRSLELRLSGVSEPPDRKKGGKPKYGDPDQMALRVKRTENKDGQAVEHIIKLGKFLYFDLDGDGQFDAMADMDEKTPRDYIFMGDQRVRVTSIAFLKGDPITVVAFDSDTRFTFDNGKWRVETPEDRRRQQGKAPDKDK